MVLNHIAKIITPSDSRGQDSVRESQSPTTAKIKKSQKNVQKFARITKSVTFAALSIFYLTNYIY